MIKILNKWMEPDEYANQSQKDRQDILSGISSNREFCALNLGHLSKYGN